MTRNTRADRRGFVTAIRVRAAHLQLPQRGGGFLRRAPQVARDSGTAFAIYTAIVIDPDVRDGAREVAVAVVRGRAAVSSRRVVAWQSKKREPDGDGREEPFTDAGPIVERAGQPVEDRTRACAASHRGGRAHFTPTRGLPPEARCRRRSTPLAPSFSFPSLRRTVRRRSPVHAAFTLVGPPRPAYIANL